MPAPDVNLGVGSGTHAEQTAAIMVGLEAALRRAPAGAGRRLRRRELDRSPPRSSRRSCSIPVAHVEAGLRSFDRTMPEEINRRVTDPLSDLLFVTCPEGLPTSAARASPAGADPLRRQPDDRHAAGATSTASSRPRAERLGLATRVRGRDPAPPAQRRRSRSPSDWHGTVAALHAVADQADWSSRSTPAAASGHRRRPVRPPRGVRSSTRSAISSSWPGPRRRARRHRLRRGAGGDHRPRRALPDRRPNTERPSPSPTAPEHWSTPEDLVRKPAAVPGQTGSPATWPIPPLWDGGAGPRIAATIQASSSRLAQCSRA